MKRFFQIISIASVLGLILPSVSFGIAPVGGYRDTETSNANIFSAATLDFHLTNQNVSGFVGMENDGEIFHTSVAIPESGSMPMQYFVSSTSTSPVCSEFRVRVKQNETEIFEGPLPNFLSDRTTIFGTWKFEFDLPIGAAVTQGDLCQANIIFSAWREEIDNPEESGFFDIETLSLNLKAKTIVLNEVLAYPNPSHTYPSNREFIELKNNGNVPVDVAGWEVSEMTGGGVENKYTITTAGGSYTASPYGGSTIIPAGGWLVLLLSDGTGLNNDGDTIRLYDSSDNKLDEYSYKIAKYGESDARYLDGVGAWVDPIPTPGGQNILEEETEEPIIEEPAAEEPVVVEETALVVETKPAEEVVPTEEVPVVGEPVLEEEIQAPEEPAQEQPPVPEEPAIPEEPLIIEQETVIEPEPVVAPVDDSDDNSEGDSSASSGVTGSSDGGSADSGAVAAE